MPYTSPYTLDFPGRHASLREEVVMKMAREQLPPAPYGYKYEEVRVYIDQVDRRVKFRGRYEYDPEQK